MWSTSPGWWPRCRGEPVLTLPSSVRVLLATEPVDMRKSIDGLMALVRLARFGGQWGYAANSLGRTERSYSTGLK